MRYFNLIPVFTACALLFGLNTAEAKPPKPVLEKLPNAQYYRDLTMRIRKSGVFQYPSVDGKGTQISYQMEVGEPSYAEPKLSDASFDIMDLRKIWRLFWDRVYLKDGSYMQIGEDKIPLTCIWVSGWDNRANGNQTPLVPKVVMRVMLVANDYTCQGPVRPGWPETGGKKDAWDTYLHFEVKDPTIMLPQDASVRFRGGSFSLILIDGGPQ